MFNSLFSKIMSSYILIPILILLVLVTLLPRYLEDYIFKTKEQELLRKSEIVRNAIAADKKNMSNLLAAFEKMLDTGVLVVNEEGEIINRGQRMRGMMVPGMMKHSNTGMMRGPMHGNRNLSGLEEEINKVLAGETVTFRGESPMLNESVIAVGVPLESSRGLALFLISPLQGLREMAYKIRNLTLQVAAAAVLLALAVAYFITRGIVSPVKQMQEKAYQLAAGNFNVRLSNLPKDEIGALGESFNYLAEELEQSVAELNTEKNRMQSMLNSMTEGVLGVSKAQNILLANPKLKEIFAIEERIMGQQVKKYFNQELVSLVEEVLTSQEESKIEFEYQEKIITVQAAPIYRQAEELWGVIVLARDVTQIRKLEEMRRLFVANVSHELKTPLTAVQGYIEAILDGVAKEAELKRKYLKRVMTETNRMSRLVTDMLDLSKLQSGQIDFNLEEVNLVKVVKSVLMNLEPKLKEREVLLEAPEEVLVTTDRDRVREVLINLLTNAVKFTEEEGEIKVKLIDNEKKVRVKIIDDGVGIPKADLPYIWERFYQVDRSRSLDKEGTGLGLAIVKEIIEGLGGEVRVDSEEGKGSEFSFVIPKV